MVSVIGSSSFYPATGGGSSAVGLGAQLARYEQQLSDWACCPSAKTQGGKQKIQEISGKISEVRARIAEAEKAKTAHMQANSKPALASVTAAAANNDVAAVNSGRTGSIVDVLA